MSDIRSQMDTVKANIAFAYKQKTIAAINLCTYYAAMAMTAFRQLQASNKYWHNRTWTAINTVFGDKEITSQYVGWFLSHLEDYGVYLEIANNRKHAALLPTTMRFYSRFIADCEKIFGVAS